MLKLLRALPWAAVVEKASIDECYILIQAPAAGPRAPPVGAAGGAAGAFDVEDNEDEESIFRGGAWAVSPQIALLRAHEAKAAGDHFSGLLIGGPSLTCCLGVVGRSETQAGSAMQLV